MDPRLEEASDALYAGRPAEFVARRDALAGQARAAGERELAASLKALRRPTVGAWYLNSAARAGLIALRDLLNLGQELREAQSGGDLAALRGLAARRGPLVSRVLRDLTAHLAELGATATPAALDEVRRTLAAALADPEVAELTRRGRLDRTYDYSGFGPAVPATTDAPSPTGQEKQKTPASDERGEPAAVAGHQAAAARAVAAEQAAAELAAAEQALAAAAEQRTGAETATAAARTRVAELVAELDEAQRRLDTAEADLATATGQERRAAEAVRRAQRGATRPGGGIRR